MNNITRFGEDLCVFVGLDPNEVCGLTVRARVGEVPTVTVEMFCIHGSNTHQIERRYRLADIAPWWRRAARRAHRWWHGAST